MSMGAARVAGAAGEALSFAGAESCFYSSGQSCYIDIRHEQTVDIVLHHFGVAAFIAGDNGRAC